MAAERRRRLPLGLKLAYTAFMAVMVPVYWYNWGPTNFLYFCDLALFFTLVALWTENPLLASIPAVGILAPQALWVADFITGGHVTGMTKYMFVADTSFPSVFGRTISLFHGWLPFLLLYTVWRLGYDRRALAIWTVLAWAVMTVCYLWLPPPPDQVAAAASDPSAPQTAPQKSWKLCGNDPPHNVNYVYGPEEDVSQKWMAPNLYFALLMVAFPLGLYLPAHLVLLALFRDPRGADTPSGLSKPERPDMTE